MSQIECFFVGDIVLKGKYSHLFDEEIIKEIKKCDFSCANLEAPVYENAKDKLDKVGPSIGQNGESIKSLKEAGFTLLSIANNHIMDYGIKGLEITCKEIVSNKLQYIGASVDSESVYKPYIYKKDDYVIGVIAVGENGFGASNKIDSNGYAWFGCDKFYEAIEKMKKECSHIIVVSHAGLENCDLPLIEIRKLYRSWIDLGVSAVVAHHPHVAQGWEKYNNGVIFYSLGNCAFNKGTGVLNPESIGVKLYISHEKGVEYQVFKLIFEKETVKLNSNEDFEEYLQHCLRKLNDENYEEYISNICVKKYNEIYKSYYGAVNSIFDGSLYNILKTIYFRVLCRKSFSNQWLYHNLMIETHYWVCKRALLNQDVKL